MTPDDALADLLALKGKVAMVIGGGGGIGSAVTRLFLSAGAAVASVDRAGAPCVDDAHRLDCDLRDLDSVVESFAGFRRRFDRLDAVVHCAGITSDAVLWKMTLDSWSEVLRVNLDSAFLIMKEAVPLMRDVGGGTVVLVSSINGERGKFGQTNYAASKAGLIGLGRSAARELGRFGIRVNVIAPGLIDTAMTRELPDEVRRQSIDETVLGRAGRPEDVAQAALFLATEMSRHITGQVLRVDGGQLMA